MIKKCLLLGSVALSLLPMIAAAAPAKKMHPAAAQKTVAVLYECQKCHMQVSAATAKKDGYKDPMDGGKLVPVKAAKK